MGKGDRPDRESQLLMPEAIAFVKESDVEEVCGVK
jgi:hypothetical protein